MKKCYSKDALKVVVVLLLLSIIIFILAKTPKKDDGSKEISIIQLSPQTSTQMMGYVIITENNKIIVIDGGTEGDADNLLKYIKQYGNKDRKSVV